jgi:hypothetical protein
MSFAFICLGTNRHKITIAKIVARAVPELLYPANRSQSSRNAILGQATTLLARSGSSREGAGSASLLLRAYLFSSSILDGPSLRGPAYIVVDTSIQEPN